MTEQNDPTSEDSLTRTLYPAPSRNFLVAFAGLAVLIVGGIFTQWDDALPMVWIGWLFVIMGVLVSPMAWVNLIYRYPRIVLHPGGIEVALGLSLFLTRRENILHQWPDVGPFSVGPYFVGTHIFAEFLTKYAVCAFTDENYELLASRKDNTSPSFFNADVKISLQSFSFGQTREDAQMFCEELNRWREYFRTPETKVLHPNSDELYNQLKNKNTSATYLAIVLIAVFAPVFIMMVQYGASVLDRKSFEAAAEQGDVDAQNNMGWLYFKGNGVPQDYETAFKWYRLAAEQGHIGAQNNMGWLYFNGNGVPQDYGAALKWYKLAAEQGQINAQNQLGSMYIKGNGVQQNFRTAIKWYTRAAEQGDVSAQNNLGWMHLSGKGVPQDLGTALKWFKPAAKKGNVKAQFNLGSMYYAGRGVPQDYVIAAKWFKSAAKKGEVNAQNNLGSMYLKGNGVLQNDKTSIKWYTRAAEQGHVVAQSNLGWMYLKGKGVPQDFETALKWYKPAAEKGNIDAQKSLGAIYANGPAELRNHASAYMWWSFALSQGNFDTKKHLDILRKKMSPIQIESAQELAREWVNGHQNRQ